MSKTVKQLVTLKHKGAEIKDRFGEEQALRILKLPKSAWELADENYSFDGVELQKKTK